MDIASQYYICNKCRFRTTLFSRIEEHLLEHTSTQQPFPYFDCFDRLKALKCPSCDFSTESLILLRYHLVRKHDQQQFALKAKLKTCKKCGFCTHSNYLWIRHPIFGTCKDKKGLKVKKKKKVRISMKKEGKWYLCEKCDHRTLGWSNLKNHVINKHTPLEEVHWQHCNKCPAKYKTLNSLKKHQKFNHGSAEDHLNCPECDYSTPSRYRLGIHVNNKHVRPEEIKWVECYHCGAKFKDKWRLKLHLVKHTTKGKQFKCDQCPFETYYKITLKGHIINRHLKSEDIKWYNCQHCDYKAKMERAIKIHIQNKHSESVELVQCPHCSYKTKWNSNLHKHITRNHDDSTFKCDLCTYRAKRERTIEIHKKNKHEKKHEIGDVKLFKCEHCNYSFKFKQSLKIHISIKHNIDGEVFQCKQCNHKTHLKYNLTQHMYRMHKFEATISCENCSFVTKTKQQLQDHIFNKHKVHTEKEKLYCSHCSYFSFNKRCLKRHLKLKHEIGGKIRWYKCDKCDYKSQHKNSYVGHMYTIHNDGKLLECDQCVYKTGSPHSMRRHKKNHKMKKCTSKRVSEKFECYICGYTTNRKRYISCHIAKSHLKTKKIEEKCT